MALVIFAISIGIIYSLVALSVVFSFRVLGFPDLTPDGSFIVGASIGGMIIINTNSIGLAIIFSFAIGIIFGILTAFLHNKLKISKLLSGILTMTLLYSVSLRVMGTSNLSLIKYNTLWVNDYSESSQYYNLLIAIVITLIILFTLYFFLKTNIGLQLRALGDSESTSKNVNLDIKKLNVIGLGISNGIAGVSGCIISQYQGFVDITMGSGLVIISLTAIIIGETLLKPRNVFVLLFCAIIGMIIYQSIITIALRLGLPSTDMKIATVILTILFIFIEKIRKSSGAVNRQIGNRNI
jgi:putative tryptophan/tyrosine transport system permease protein